MPSTSMVPPVAEPGDVRHGLSQLGFAAGVLHEVDLVDDVDQALRFNDSPEHLTCAEARFPAAAAGVTEQQKIGFPHIEVGTARIRVVVAEERRHGEAPAGRALEVERRLGDETACERALAGEGAAGGERPALGAHPPRELDREGRLRFLRPGLRVDAHDGSRRPERAERRAGESGPEAHHRALRSPVCVKSLSSRPVWKS